MAGKIAFVLAASEHGSMIVNRLDFRADPQGHACGVGIMLLEQGSHEAGEIATLLDLVSSRSGGADAVILDVGANIGTHAISWARALEGRGEVIAIEAQERVFYALAGNIALNNCFNARALWAVAGSVTGVVRIPRLDHQRPANFGGLSFKPDVDQDPGQPVAFAGPSTDLVPSIRVDDLALTRLDILKIDVEGMEPDVLDGAAATIARCRPIVFAERNICGSKPIEDRLPGYRTIEAGMNLLGMHAEDSLWEKVRVSV